MGACVCVYLYERVRDMQTNEIVYVMTSLYVILRHDISADAQRPQ